MATHPSARRPGATSLLIGCATLLALLGTVASAAPAAAQHAGGSQPTSTRPPAEASQYDFLLGQWDLVVEPQVSSLAARMHGVPKLGGIWKAWRALDGWAIEDELRIVDESGNPRALTLFVRVYDSSARRWRVSAIDAYTANVSQSLATWRKAVMESSASAPATDAEGRTYAGRSRITDVTPTSFTYVQERSYDGGREWETTLRILATRVAASAPR